MARRNDLMHAHDARSHTLGAFLRRIPLVVSRRVAFPVGSRWKYGRARRYLAVSEFLDSHKGSRWVHADMRRIVHSVIPHDL